MDMLGYCQARSITKDETTIVDGLGEKAEIEARVAQIRGRSKRQLPITTVKNCKSALPNWQAVLL